MTFSLSRQIYLLQHIALRTLLLVGGSVALAQTQPVTGVRSGEHPCSLLGDTASQMKVSAPTDLLRAYKAQVHLFRSIHLVGTMRGSSTEGSPSKQRELGTIIDLLQPDMIRIDGIALYAGNRIVQLTSDGKDFGLLLPGDNRKLYLFGSVDAPPRSKDPWENLRPGPFLPALRWEEGTVQVEAHQAAMEPDTATLVIDVPGRRNAAPHKLRVHFDRGKGVVNLLTVYDGADSPIFESHYSDWRTTTSGGPDECYPRQILLVDHRQGYEVEIRIDDLTLNLDLPRSLFRPFPPRGVPVRRLDSTGP